MKALRPSQFVIIAGDVFALTLVTVFGFASHDTLDTAGARIWATFFPLLVSWLIGGKAVGMFRIEQVRDIRKIWRLLWGVLLAAPLAGWLRGLWLATPVVPVFVAVIGGSSALALLVWRSLYWFYYHRTQKASHG